MASKPGHSRIANMVTAGRPGTQRAVTRSWLASQAPSPPTPRGLQSQKLHSKKHLLGLQSHVQLTGTSWALGLPAFLEALLWRQGAYRLRGHTDHRTSQHAQLQSHSCRRRSCRSGSMRIRLHCAHTRLAALLQHQVDFQACAAAAAPATLAKLGRYN